MHLQVEVAARELTDLVRLASRSPASRHAIHDVPPERETHFTHPARVHLGAADEPAQSRYVRGERHGG